MSALAGNTENQQPPAGEGRKCQFQPLGALSRNGKDGPIGSVRFGYTCQSWFFNARSAVRQHQAMAADTIKAIIGARAKTVLLEASDKHPVVLSTSSIDGQLLTPSTEQSPIMAATMTNAVTLHKRVTQRIAAAAAPIRAI